MYLKYNLPVCVFIYQQHYKYQEYQYRYSLWKKKKLNIQKKEWKVNERGFYRLLVSRIQYIPVLTLEKEINRQSFKKKDCEVNERRFCHIFFIVFLSLPYFFVILFSLSQWFYLRLSVFVSMWNMYVYDFPTNDTFVFFLLICLFWFHLAC